MPEEPTYKDKRLQQILREGLDPEVFSPKYDTPRKKPFPAITPYDNETTLESTLIAMGHYDPTDKRSCCRRKKE